MSDPHPTSRHGLRHLALCVLTVACCTTSLAGAAEGDAEGSVAPETLRLIDELNELVERLDALDPPPPLPADLAPGAQRMLVLTIVVDERENWHGLDYYGREGFPVPVRTWRVEDGAKSYAEEFVLTAKNDSRALIASVRPAYRDRMTGDFAQFEPAGEDVVIDLGGGRVRRFEMFLASDYAPVPRSEQAEE